MEEFAVLLRQDRDSYDGNAEDDGEGVVILLTSVLPSFFPQDFMEKAAALLWLLQRLLSRGPRC